MPPPLNSQTQECRLNYDQVGVVPSQSCNRGRSEWNVGRRVTIFLVASSEAATVMEARAYPTSNGVRSRTLETESFYRACVTGSTLGALAANDDRRGALLNWLCSVRRVCNDKGANFMEARVTELARQSQLFLARMEQYCQVPFRWDKVIASDAVFARGLLRSWARVTPTSLRREYRREAVSGELCGQGHIVSCWVTQSPTCFVRWMDNQYSGGENTRNDRREFECALWDTLTLDQAGVLCAWYNWYSLCLMARAVHAPDLTKWFETALDGVASRLEVILEQGLDGGLDSTYVDVTVEM